MTLSTSVRRLHCVRIKGPSSPDGKQMLTILIDVSAEDLPKLGLTLGCLVPAAVEGLVKEVVVIDDGMGPACRDLAEEAGCRHRLSGEVGAALAEARGEWVLLLEAGSELQTGWMDAVARRVRTASATGRGGRFRLSGRRWWRLLAAVRAQRLSSGVLASRAALLARHRPGMDLKSLAAAMPTDALDAAIRPADRR